MAFALAGIFSASRNAPQTKPEISPEEEIFDQVYGELVDHIAQNMGHGWMGKHTMGGVGEYLRAENTAENLVSALNDYKTATKFSAWEFYAGVSLKLSTATKERFQELIVSTGYALAALQDPKHVDHIRITDFVSQCQRTDIPMAEANQKALINFLRPNFI
jgi:hypothetical protein